MTLSSTHGLHLGRLLRLHALLPISARETNGKLQLAHIESTALLRVRSPWVLGPRLVYELVICIRKEGSSSFEVH